MLEDPLTCVIVKQGTTTGAPWALQVEVTVTQDGGLSRTQRVTSERGRLSRGLQRHKGCRPDTAARTVVSAMGRKLHRLVLDSHGQSDTRKPHRLGDYC